MEFSFYRKGIKNIRPAKTMLLSEAISLIKGETYREQVFGIRGTQDKNIRHVLKSNLDYFTFSGIFEPTRKVENLKLHSGLITIDFDDVENIEDVISELYPDPYTLVGFISPSGNGIKLLVKVDGQKHLESFIGLAKYYKSKYNLTVDESGKDVSRVCYVSHDERAYYNQNSEPFTVIDKVSPVAPKPVVTKTDIVMGNDKEAHVALVVNRIIDGKVDITNNYSDEWLLVGFSLATLGEPGREFFHAVSQINENYNEADTNSKFNNFIKTTRFKNPAKFFSIAKKYGVDISKKTKEKTSNDVSDTPEKKVRDFSHSITYLDDFAGIKYWAGSRSGSKMVCNNYHINIEYLTKDEQERVNWILKIQRFNEPDEPLIIELNNDDFNMAKAWKRRLTEHALSFKASDEILTELIDYLFVHTKFKRAVKILRYGWHQDSQTFLFANMAFQNDKMIAPDSYGMIHTDTMHISLPQLKSANKERFFWTDNNIKFDEWYELFRKAYLEEYSFFTTAYYIFSVFWDIATSYRKINTILYIKGRPNSGKTTMIELLGNLYGFVQKGVNLKSESTLKSVAKILSQTQNGFLHGDEYYEGSPYTNTFIAAFDCKGYDRTADDGASNIETENIPVTRGIVLTSNDEPRYRPFVSRCLYLVKDDIQKSDEQTINYNKLDEIGKQGLACVTVEILKYRSLIKEQYAQAFEELLAATKKRVAEKDVETRNFLMTIQVLTAAYILRKEGKISLGLDADNTDDVLHDFSALAARQIVFQHRKQAEKTGLSQFMELFQSFYDSYRIYEGTHFRFTDLGEKILINFSSIYPIFQKEYFQLYRELPPSKDEILDALAQLVETDKENIILKTARFVDEKTEGEVKLNKVVNSPISVSYAILQETFGLDFMARPDRENKK